MSGLGVGYGGVGATQATDAEVTAALDTIPEAAWRPTGAIAETISRRCTLNVAVSALTSGTLYLTAVSILTGKVITSISVMSGSTALGSGSNQWFCLVDSSLNVLRKTSDDTNTAWTANTVKTLNLSSTFTTTYTGLHYVGILIVASTMPTFAGAQDTSSLINGVAPLVAGSSTAGLTDPASLGATAEALTTSSRKPWAWVS